jgi:hypothetical protein
MRYETIWEFKTRNFIVTLDVAPEETDPSDSFESQEDIDAVRSGKLEWFTARVGVFLRDAKGERGTMAAADYLGGCAYKSVREFYTLHRDPDPMNRNCSAMRAANGNVTYCEYFTSMVREAITAARANLKSLPKLRNIA